MEKLKQIIITQFDLSDGDLRPDTNLRDLIDDSLDFIEFIILLEDEYGIDIPDQDINKMVTLKETYDYLANTSGKK